MWLTAINPEEWNAIHLSIKVSLVAVALSLPLAMAVALMLARKNFWGKSLVNALVHLPLVIPPVVTGYLLLIGFGRTGMFGRFFAEVFGLVFAFRWTGAALACGVMAFPLVVRAIRLSFEAVDRRLEENAADLGANPLLVFLTITLPLSLPGVLAGVVLGFAKSMGEFGATITFVSNIPDETQTLPSAIHSLMQVPGGDYQAMRLTLISIALSFAALLVSEALARRINKRLSVA